jgi:exportin-T
MSSDPIDDTKRSFLVSLLKVILEKMKWDEEADPEDMDDDDKAAFEGLRKVLTHIHICVNQMGSFILPYV